MITLDDLFDPLDLDAALNGGFVRAQTHPTLPLRIWNYTELAAYSRAWTQVTLQCRGLVVHAETGEVVARPLRKFFNVAEPGAYQPDGDENVIVTEKQDGSLGIGVPTGDGGYLIATRGSFTSVQAQHATALWQDRYADRVTVPSDITPLWEIVYPENRIVVDNGDLDDLVLLGAVHIPTGNTYTPTEAAEALAWPGPVTETHPFRTFAEALAAPQRDNREGYVLHFPRTDGRLKLKHDRYVELHRIVTGMNERVVWEHLGNGGTVDELALPLPDEFRPWVHAVAARLETERDAALAAARAACEQLLASLPDGWTRKDYALRAAEHADLRPWLFNLLDGRDPSAAIWKTLRPSGAVAMTGTTEDAA